MILRRLSLSLREQNWTAIWIEFVLLVCGVFLGIQAANWNETRRDRALETEYIERLQRDFHAIDTRLGQNVLRWQQKTAAPVRLLADLEAFQEQGAWPRAKADMLKDLNDTPNGAIPAPRAATYVELLAVGKLGLIRNSTLRDALLDYDVQTGFTMKAYDVLVQRTDPYMGAIVAPLQFDRRMVDFQPVTEVAVRNVKVWDDVDLEELAAEPRLKAALNMYASSASNQLSVALLQQAKAKAVLAILAPGTERAEDGRQ